MLGFDAPPAEGHLDALGEERLVFDHEHAGKGLGHAGGAGEGKVVCLRGARQDQRPWV